MEPVRMPLRTVEVELSEIGYPGWKVIFWLNPPARLYDKYMAVDSDDSQGQWEAFCEFIRDWNFADQEGIPWARPGKLDDYPRKVCNYLVSKWHQLFNEESRLPKELFGLSENSSQTSTSDQKTVEDTQSQESTSQLSSQIDSKELVPTTG